MLRHFVIDVVLHAQRIVERGIEGLVYVRRCGLDGSVHIQVAHALGGKKYAFHNVFVVHCRASLYKLVKLCEQSLVAVEKLLRLLAQYGVCKLACGGAALGHEILGVTERVLNIEQFLRAHGYRSSLFYFVEFFDAVIICTRQKYSRGKCCIGNLKCLMIRAWQKLAVMVEFDLHL